MSIMKFIFMIAVIFSPFLVSPAYSQSQDEFLRDALKIYSRSTGSDAGGLLGGISMWGIAGMILFSGIGFIAFTYGRKNSLFKPLLIGILLIVYSYFFKETLWIYLIGTALTAALYIFRD